MIKKFYVFACFLLVGSILYSAAAGLSSGFQMDLDTQEESLYSIVFPGAADFGEGRISVLAALATALLGCRRGTTVEFEAPRRVRRLYILDILYQPESAGDFDL